MFLLSCSSNPLETKGQIYAFIAVRLLATMILTSPYNSLTNSLKFIEQKTIRISKLTNLLPNHIQLYSFQLFGSTHYFLKLNSLNSVPIRFARYSKFSSIISIPGFIILDLHFSDAKIYFLLSVNG